MGRQVARVPHADGTWSPELVYCSSPQLPGPDWALVRVTTAGICGSDLRGLSEAFANVIDGEAVANAAPDNVRSTSPPGGVKDRVVPGHEIVGIVVKGPLAGTRVVVHPLVLCVARGTDPCVACRDGRYGQCRSFGSPVVRWGKSLGLSSELGGGWGDWVIAHRSMLRPVPEELPERTAVLAEPLSVAIAGLRAVRGAPSNDVVVIVGGGTLGLLTAVAAESVLRVRRRLVLVRHDFQADAVRALGAEPLAASVAIPAPTASRPLLSDGPSLVIDAGGTSSSLVAAMGIAAAGGVVLTLGNPNECLDLTHLWLRGLTLVGHMEHSTEPVCRPPERRDSLDEALRLLALAPDLGETLVTHAFPFDQVRAALSVARQRARHRSIKVLFERDPRYSLC